MAAPRADFVLSRVLAIVLPLGILALAVVRLTERTFDTQRQLDNAGQLLNGEVLKVPVEDAIHKRMARNPALVVIGNSFANTNVQISMLSAEVGLDRKQAARLSIPNTIGAHWYALLKHRVFNGDYIDPDVIVIVSDLQSMLLVEPLSQGSFGNLDSLLTGPDAEIEAKVGRPMSFIWSDIQSNRTILRRSVIQTVRETSGRGVVKGKAKKARKNINDAMDRVFHASRMDASLRVNQLPVTVGAESTQIDLDALPQPGDSFLPDIARLCDEHGARLVLVRNRESPLMPSNRGDRVPPGTVEKVRAAIAPWGGVMLEMDAFPMIDAHYDNLDHMTEDGSKRFTGGLVEVFRDLGIPDRAAAYVRPPPPDASPLLGSVGPATIRRSWKTVPAGSDAVWHWSEDWPDAPDTFRVRGVFEGAPPVVKVAGVRVPLQRLPSGRWIAQHVGVGPIGPWEITVSAPNGDTHIEGFEVGTGSTPLYLAGYRPDVRGHQLELLGRVEVLSDEVFRDAVRPTFESPPPPLPNLIKKAKHGPGPTASIDSKELRTLADGSTRRLTPLLARCSPVRVLEDGVELPHSNVGCREVRENGNGRMCHSDKRIFYTATSGDHPLRNGRKYRVVLDEDRECDGGFWLYPGDHATVNVPAARLRELRDGVHKIEFLYSIADVRSGEPSIAVEVWVDDTRRDTLRLEDRGSLTSARLVFNPPIEPASEVRLEVRNEGGEVYALMDRITLRPPPVVWEGFDRP